jgi:hypothetical protein
MSETAWNPSKARNFFYKPSSVHVATSLTVDNTTDCQCCSQTCVRWLAFHSLRSNLSPLPTAFLRFLSYQIMLPPLSHGSCLMESAYYTVSSTVETLLSSHFFFSNLVWATGFPAFHFQITSNLMWPPLQVFKQFFIILFFVKWLQLCSTPSYCLLFSVR